MPAYTLESQLPFGLLVRADFPGQTIAGISAAQLTEWVQAHRILIFRGFELFDKTPFALYAQQLGEPLQWPFGAINELKVKADAKNYLYTPSAVPLHWDGAFIGRIPYLIFFQCVKAPRAEDRGGTTFADTGRALARATAAQRARWAKATLRYRTEKIVHYGGTLTQRLLQAHPVTGEPTLRFAEPVRDLNPVSVEVLGATPAEQADLIAELQAALYAPEVFYIHSWQDNDIVLADNHVLLHGRDAFLNPNERHIQRINLLARPAHGGLAQFLKNSKTLRRTEFLIAEIPIFLIPIFLSAEDFRFLKTPVLYVGLAGIYLLFNFGDMVNAYADRRVDAVYKSHLSNAIFELGGPGVRWQMRASVAGTVLISIWLTQHTGRWQFVPLTLIGWALGFQYSWRPIHFKSRGLWQLSALWAVIFFGPMAYTGSLVTRFPKPAVLTLAAAYGLLQVGVLMLNNAEDYTEDRAAGLHTAIVALGLHRSMRVAQALTSGAGLLVLGSFAYLFRAEKLPKAAYGALLPLAGAVAYVAQGYETVNRKIADLDEVAATAVLKENGMRVPQWLKATAYTSLLAASVLFAARVLRPKPALA
ncbi:TauD/TfdA family dioxygenase [Hymenobacter psychrophilus]|uniref:Taurine dioxygenase, alpha-ketoglutarate-dependent n=1 Tax=Hymenobacter psychrophilus TaxID=651662 RepID=A0A1H3P648_9BACT|nr:TauD/TfdA family dioxygenase [Hymenobacter psychrophilus]SDY96624.1 Taurine dioxygenase, alpha-ketoglutarate-dependent [Hymenobacter psychrophilus]